MPIEVLAVPAPDLDDCLAIRARVFIEEQGVPLELEIDGLDPQALHVLALNDGRPVGTARMRPVEGHAKVERVAVLAEARGTGAGRALMEALHGHDRRLGLPEIELHAQVQVIGFYERLGYRAFGPMFLDAGIEHRAMRLRL